MEDLSRRFVLKFIAAAILGGTTSGCSLLEPEPKDPIDPFDVNCDIDCFPVFDAHAHFFNATDLQAGGYLLGPVLNDYMKLPDSQFLKRFIENLGKAVQNLGNIVAPSATKEIEYLKALRQKSLIPFELTNQIDPDEDYRRASNQFYDELSKSKSDLDEISYSYRQAQIEVIERTVGTIYAKKLLPTVEISNFNKDSLYNSLSDPLSNKIRLKPSLTSPMEMDSTTLAKIEMGLRKIQNILQFVGRMLTYRSTNLVSYKQIFTPKNGASVIKVLDVTCDFDYWLGCTPPLSEMEEQIELHELLHELSGGYNEPMLGVNPWTLFIKNQSYIDLIDRTLERGIFKGIKLYPSIGYSVTGVIRDDTPKCGTLQPTQQDIKLALDQIFRIVAKYGAVVMAHTTKSKGASQSSLELGGPKYWEELLEKYPNLNVNFGHMGDIDDTDGWNSEFYRLMIKFDGAYGDIGYWIELMGADTVKSIVSKLTTKYGVKIFDKIMYGSDWYMISTEDDSNRYLSEIYKNFDKEVEEKRISDTHRKRFFYGNAINLFSYKRKPQLNTNT